MSKRKIFDELMEGVAAMKSHRRGKITLRTYRVEAAPLPKVDSKLIRDTRKRLRCSRAVFARKLRINERTLEKWEQGRAKPNPQAAALVLLVRKYPDTLDRLHCFCECKESLRERHKTLLTCFTSEHAAGCGICQREAILAARLKDQGLPDEQVELTVESAAKTDGHPPTFGRGL